MSLISRETLGVIIQSNTQGLWIRDESQKRLEVNDDYYYVPTTQEVKAFLAWAKPGIPAASTDGELFDCDYYAKHLVVEAAKHARVQGSLYKWSLGRVSGLFTWIDDGKEPHSCNWVHVQEGGIRWLEPQTCEFPAPGDCLPESIRTVEV